MKTEVVLKFALLMVETWLDWSLMKTEVVLKSGTPKGGNIITLRLMKTEVVLKSSFLIRHGIRTGTFNENRSCIEIF